MVNIILTQNFVEFSFLDFQQEAHSIVVLESKITETFHCNFMPTHHFLCYLTIFFSILINLPPSAAFLGWIRDTQSKGCIPQTYVAKILFTFFFGSNYNSLGCMLVLVLVCTFLHV